VGHYSNQSIQLIDWISLQEQYQEIQFLKYSIFNNHPNLLNWKLIKFKNVCDCLIENIYDKKLISFKDLYNLSVQIESRP
jgi:hypothetical protein